MTTTNSQISMLGSMLSEYSNAYTLVSGKIEIPNTGTAAAPNNRKFLIIKTCAPFIDSIRELSNTQIYNAKDIDVLMTIYNKLYNTAIIIQEQYNGNTIEMNHF